MDITKVVEWLRLSTPQLFWLFLFASVVLTLLAFAPEEALGTLGLRDLRVEYRTVIGLSWILSSSGLLVTGSKFVFEWTKGKVERKRRSDRLRLRLHLLTPAERAILQKYIAEDTRTQKLSLYDGVARELVREHIIFTPNNVRGYENSLPHNIQPWAWDYLKKNPKLLGDSNPGAAFRRQRH